MSFLHTISNVNDPLLLGYWICVVITAPIYFRIFYSMGGFITAAVLGAASSLLTSLVWPLILIAALVLAENLIREFFKRRRAQTRDSLISAEEPSIPKNDTDPPINDTKFNHPLEMGNRTAIIVRCNCRRDSSDNVFGDVF